MKKVLIALPILVILVVLIIFFFGKGQKSQAKFVTSDIQRGDISITVTATGSLEAVKTVQVGSQISGTISALDADFNDRVIKGQVLAQLDPAPLRAQVAQAEADLEKSQVSAELARQNYERSLSLFGQNLISESDKETALTNYELAKADVKSSQANLDRLKTNLAYATITSPIDGVVISRNVDVGQTVAASLQAPTLFTIAEDLTQMQVNTSVDEADIGKIREGQIAIFTVDAYPERIFQGQVKQIRLSPEIVQNVVSYDVILNVSNPDLSLKPGMTANVTIQVEHLENVLKVPSGALRFHPVFGSGKSPLRGSGATRMAGGFASGGAANSSAQDPSGARKANQTLIWILDPQGKPKPVPVEAGISDGTLTEVISDNLKQGDKVIVGQEGAATSTGSQDVNPFLPRFGGGRR
jgi:HlyD family secretion protein